MNARRMVPVVVLALASCNFEASCGSGGLNMEKAREFVGTTLEREVGQKPAVTCPDSVKAEAGASFECIAAFGDVKATVTIKQNDAKGNVTIAAISGILIASKLEATIGEGLKAQLQGEFKVSCGARVRPSTAGERFTCDAVETGGSARSGKVAVTVKDAVGNVEWKTEDAPAAPAP